MVMLTLTSCPAVPLKVYLAFCPIAFVVTVSAVPGVMVPTMSLNVLNRTVALPVAVPPGSIASV